jgi:hypothetical protein
MKDYSCNAHGYFEAWEPVCPKGCKGAGMIQVVHLQATSFVTSKTKNLDKTIRGLAKEFNLTDMNNKDGQPVKRPDPKTGEREKAYQEYIKKKFGDTGWAQVQKGGIQDFTNGGKVVGGTGGGGAVQTIQGFGAEPGSALSKDKTGNVSVVGGEFAIPLSRNIIPDTIVGQDKTEIKI